MSGGRSSPLRSRAGLTLLEVLVSATILAGLALVVMVAMIPLSTASSEQGAGLDMDRVATKVFAQLRRELRQSGYDGTNAKFGVNLPTLGTFLPSDTILLAAPQPRISFMPRKDDDEWDNTIVWLHDAATQTVKRTYPGSEPSAGDIAPDTDADPSTNRGMVMADQVANLTFQVVDAGGGDPICVVTLELTRTSNRGVTLRRTYVDKIEMMNR